MLTRSFFRRNAILLLSDVVAFAIVETIRLHAGILSVRGEWAFMFPIFCAIFLAGVLGGEIGRYIFDKRTKGTTTPGA